MRQLIVWDKETGVFLRKINLSGEEAIYDQQEFEIKLSESKKGIDQIIILAGLEWENKYVQNFYGFQLATELRRDHKVTCPIIIVSFFPKLHFEKLSKNNPEDFNIIYAPGTGFIDLTNIKEKLQEDKNCLHNYISSLPELTPPLLEDINEMLLSLRGFIVDKITHDLKFQYSIERLNKILDDVKYYLSKGQLERISFNEYKGNILEARKQDSEDQFNKAKNKLCDICESEIGTDTNALKSVKIKEKKISKVLVIEDDPDQSEKIREHLEHSFDLIITNDCNNAISEIEKDKDNGIIAIIADWRLLKYKNGSPTSYWQNHQGYEILRKAAQTHFVTLISLTAESDKNVHQIRNELGINIQLFKKEHVYSETDKSQWSLFSDILKDKCKDVMDLIASLPNTTAWKRKYQKNYRQVRSAIDWNTIEDSITKGADALWNYYRFSLEGNFHLKDLNSMGLPLNKLSNILKARRVFFALYYSIEKNRISKDYHNYLIQQPIYHKEEYKGNSVFDVFSILRDRYWADEDNINYDKFDQAKKNLIGSLCITDSNLPYDPKLLPEEKKWLHRHNIPFLDILNIEKNSTRSTDEETKLDLESEKSPDSEEENMEEIHLIDEDDLEKQKLMIEAEKMAMGRLMAEDLIENFFDEE